MRSLSDEKRCGVASGSCRNGLVLEECSRPTDVTLSGSQAALSAFAVPHERSGVSIPARGGVLEPGNELGRSLRVLSIQGSPADNALDGLGHVQPRSTQWRVQRHHAMSEQPGDDRRTQVACQIVPDEQQTEWWQGWVWDVVQPGGPICC